MAGETTNKRRRGKDSVVLIIKITKRQLSKMNKEQLAFVDKLTEEQSVFAKADKEDKILFGWTRKQLHRRHEQYRKNLKPYLDAVRKSGPPE